MELESMFVKSRLHRVEGTLDELLVSTPGRKRLRQCYKRSDPGQKNRFTTSYGVSYWLRAVHLDGTDRKLIRLVETVFLLDACIVGGRI